MALNFHKQELIPAPFGKLMRCIWPFKYASHFNLWYGEGILNLGTRNRYRLMTYPAVAKMLRKLAKKAGIKKELTMLTPHVFRHARATHLASKLRGSDEGILWLDSELRHGISLRSSIWKRYRWAILRIHGKLEKPRHEQPTTQVCQICKHENAPEMDFCLRCRDR